jgi:hypothetical protein
MKKKYIVLAEGLTQPIYYNISQSKRTPKLWRSQRAAELEMLEDYILKLEEQIDEYKSRNRAFEDIEFAMDTYVTECLVDDKGQIFINGNELIYDPKNP